VNELGFACEGVGGKGELFENPTSDSHGVGNGRIKIVFIVDLGTQGRVVLW